MKLIIDHYRYAKEAFKVKVVEVVVRIYCSD